MGGYVALNLALQQPKMIQSIVTLGTKFDWSPEAVDKELRMLNPDKIEDKVPKFAEKLKQNHSPADWKEVMHKTVKIMKGMGEGKRMELKQMSQIKLNVVIGLGTEDKMVTETESIEVANELSNGKFIKLEGMQHPIDSANPKDIENYIKESLKA